MTSALRGGGGLAQKKMLQGRLRECSTVDQSQMRTGVGGWLGSKNPKFLRTSFMDAPLLCFRCAPRPHDDDLVPLSADRVLPHARHGLALRQGLNDNKVIIL